MFATLQTVLLQGLSLVYPLHSDLVNMVETLFNNIESYTQGSHHCSS